MYIGRCFYLSALKLLYEILTSLSKTRKSYAGEKSMPYPYVPSGGIIQQAVDQFKKALPSKVDSATLKKLGVAPSNEGYVINTLKFLGLVDTDNSRTDAGVALFSTHGDAFAPALEAVVREKYDALFELRGDESWGLDRDALISFLGKRTRRQPLSAQGRRSHSWRLRRCRESGTLRRRQRLCKIPNRGLH